MWSLPSWSVDSGRNLGVCVNAYTTVCCWPPGQDGVNPLRVEIAEGWQLWPSLRVSVLQVGKSGKARMGRGKARMDQQAWHLGALYVVSYRWSLGWG